MTVTTEDTRYSRADLARIITEALVNCDYAHVTDWARPESCPCHAAGTSCLLPPDSGCQGYAEHVPLPPEKSLTADELVAALPEPDSAGMVSAVAAGDALGRLVSTRLSWSPYRRSTMFARLGEALESLEEPAAGGSKPDQPPAHALRCQWCTGPIPAERGPKARYCSNSHRVTAHRARKRTLERANATPAANR